MFLRRLCTVKQIKSFNPLTNICENFHKNSKFLPPNILTKHDLRPVFFHSVPHSSKTIPEKSIPILIGITVAGGALVGYSLLRKKETSSADVVDVEFREDPPYIHPNLNEDLSLLREFGPIPYLLIGAGCASFAAYRVIRSRDPTSKVIMIGDESYLPYMRPPLSKEMWFDEKLDNASTLAFSRWDGRSRSIFYEPPEYFFSVKEVLDHKNGGLAVIRGKKVVKIDPNAQIITLDRGESLQYKKCLLAPGSIPKKPIFLDNLDPFLEKRVLVFKTIPDYKKLDWIIKRAKTVAIIGGGFLGSELACGLVNKGKSSKLEVIQIFQESGNLGETLPEYLSKWTSEVLKKDGIKILPNVNVKSVSQMEDKVVLSLSDGSSVSADYVVVDDGADPNVGLAKNSGLELDAKNGGFLVNAEMEARKNLWIAGDAASFYDPKLGRRQEMHYDNAVVCGRIAGTNMTGDNKSYGNQSMFWSDLGNDIGFEAVGIVDASLQTVGVFVKPDKTNDIAANEKETIVSKDTQINYSSDKYSKGVIFYLRENIIVGVVLWNVFSKLQTARQIIEKSMTSEDLVEIARLFELHSLE